MPLLATKKQLLETSPLVKWAGGKRQLLADIKLNLPPYFKRYFEPFIGGGAVFFELQHEGAYISDVNAELINVYKVVQNNPQELIESLFKHQNTKEYFLKIRSADREPFYGSWSDVEKASRFLFLNRTCFNGLYRVNSKGYFNVPYGNYSNPRIIDAENILSCSELLQNTDIQCTDFAKVLEYTQKGDFVYFDPPYVPLNSTSSFTSYTKEGFDIDMQYRLRDLCNELNRRGVFFLLSNSDTPVINELYSAYNLQKVYASRAINATSTGRGKVSEVLVKNYK